MQHYHEIERLLNRVRARWRAMSILRAATRAALACSLVGAVALLLAHWALRAPLALAALGLLTAAGVFGCLAWALAPLRRIPSDRRVARFVEERAPGLEDRLVSAVDVVQSERYGASPAIIEPMLADAARRANEVNVDAVVPAGALRRTGTQAAGALAVAVVLLVSGRETSRQAWDAMLVRFFPAHVRLDVTPGHARVRAGSPLTVTAGLVGNRAPVTPQLEIGDGTNWRRLPMDARDGRFNLVVPSISRPFKYRVVAGGLLSPVFDVTVAHPPKVTRIDVDYTYPAGLGLPPHTEQDAGDVYAPAGTQVRVRVHTDRPVARGALAMGNRRALALAAEGDAGLAARLTVVEDDSYRVALTDAEGLASDGDTEYFIRMLEDRPPEVRVLKPASDRQVTRLEEVDIEAEAQDDYGIDRMDLVYSVRGGDDRVVPFPIPRRATQVQGRRTLSLEDLDVKPGDFVSYYVRARDLTRGKRSSEARSDIFFLEVKPFEQEFTLAQSQAMAGAGTNRSIDDLVTAQKEIVVATWKLDRRAQNANGARSEQDVRAVARAEADLKARVEDTSGTFRESVMRDPRKRQPQRGRGGPAPATPPAGTALPEEAAMAAAAEAMGKAVTSLDALNTKGALPPEMEALNRLLKAQADVKQRQVARQQAGSGAGNNNRNYDLSTLFDKELQRTQQTNYETPTSTEQKDDKRGQTIDKIKELAARQDELIKRQKELADKRAGMSEEELKRQLEKLTRDQLELRQKAEELAGQMESRNQPGQQAQTGQKGQQGQQSQTGQQGQQSQAGQQSQPGQQTGRGQLGSQQQSQQGASSQGAAGGQNSRSGENAGRMRDVTDAMRDAAGNLRRQDPAQASASGNRALQKLRDLEQQLQANARPDDRRRALGDMQLESRQLADAQRQISSELSKLGQGDAAKDALRRLAGEQDRLGERVKQLQDGLKQQASSGRGQASDPRSGGARGAGDPQAAAADAARDLERQRLGDRMQQAASQMRAAAGEQQAKGAQAGRQGDEGQPASPAQQPQPRDAQGTTPGAGAGQPSQAADPQRQAQAQQDMARALDKIADRLASATGGRDGESRKLSEQLAKAQALRDKLSALGRDMTQAATPQAAQPGAKAGAPGGAKASGDTGRTGQGQSGGATGGDLARLREEYARQLQQTRELIDQLRREDPLSWQSGAGFTYEGQGMTLSAPGTEAFKQDFARWQELNKQATQALDRAESSLSKKLQEKESHDRLAAGADDRAPSEYQRQVDSYFKALAVKKK